MSEDTEIKEEVFIREGAKRCLGKTFGKLTVLGVDFSKGKGIWVGSHLRCACGCGNTISPSSHDLEKGNIVSCGCHKTETDIELIKNICAKETKVTLYTDVDNLYLAKRDRELYGFCEEHGMIHTTIGKVCRNGVLCARCNRKPVVRKETLEVGTKVKKSDITFEIVDVLRPPYVVVVDIDYKERGSFSTLRSNLFSDHMIRSPVRPFREDWPAYMGIGEYDTVNSPKAHSKWLGMFRRCYSNESHNMEAYRGCTVTECWWDFQVFAKWFYENYREDGTEYHLDKDILVKGNRVYSENTCCFVPRDINILFTSRKNHRGDSLLGVYYKKKNKQYCAQCADGSGGAQVYLGLYPTENDAFAVYKDFKECVIKKQAEKFKDFISKEVYTTLINYSVEKGD